MAKLRLCLTELDASKWLSEGLKLEFWFHGKQLVSHSNRLAKDSFPCNLMSRE